MRISPVLILLSVLVLSGACTQTVPSAIANDDRPSSTQPTIAPSAVPKKLTIRSLAGTYQWQAVINEQWLAELLKAERRMGLDEKELKQLEEFTRSAYIKSRITIYADGWFDWQDSTSEKILHGKVKLDGNKLNLSDTSDKPIKSTDASTKVSTPLTLDVSADGKNILFYDPQNPAKLLRGYVKQ